MNRVHTCPAPAAIVAGLLLALPAAAEPVSLSGCIDYALRHSRELKTKEIAEENQKLTTLAKRAKFAFNLETQATDKEGDTSASLTLKKEIVGGVDVSSTYKTTRESDADEDQATDTFSVRISKVILGGGSVRESRLDIDNSLIDEVIRLNELNKFRRELRNSITKAYYGVIRNTQTLRVWDLRLERAKKNLEHAVERENPLDIATARIQVPENEASRLSAERRIESSLDGLKELMGMDITNKLAIDQQFAFETEAINVTNDTVFSSRNHEDLLNSRLEHKKLENQARVQGAKVWPKVSLWGNASTTVADSTDDGDTGNEVDDDDDYSAGLSLAWEVMSPTARTTHKKLLNDIRSKTLATRTLEQQKSKEIRDLGRRLEEALLLVRLQEEKMKINARRVELYSDRWKNGEIDILEYIRSQNELENTRIQLITQRTTYMDLLSQYRFAVGK
ncbi:TolC family protein [Verrucomicrobiota bacterium]